jgi:hypothetical protein
MFNPILEEGKKESGNANIVKFHSHSIPESVVRTCPG